MTGAMGGVVATLRCTGVAECCEDFAGALFVAAGAARTMREVSVTFPGVMVGW